MITVIDYGMGNLGSLINMFRRIGVKAVAESDSTVIAKAEKLVLPGVGAFDAAMRNINSISNLRKMIYHKVNHEKTPLLGICLGMQLLTDSSEEGTMSGLGLIAGKSIRFPKMENLKVPHMGWNGAKCIVNNRLTRDIPINAKYYFVHSYYVKVKDASNILMSTKYGLDFESAIYKENIYGVQFHPEKSHTHGMKILKNFVEL